MARIVVVEDDHAVREAVVRVLTAIGHEVRSSGTAMDGLHEIVGSAPDVVVIDLGLPDLDGYDLLRMLRGVSDVPVVVATARDDEHEVIRLLDAGADDYVVKPFAPAHLEARIRAVLRRARTRSEPQELVVGELRIDQRSHEATLSGARLDLSRKEFELLAYLAEHAGELVDRGTLLTAVWRQPYGGSDKTIDVHLSWLRRKLGETAKEPRYLRAVRGVGIKLVDPATDADVGTVGTDTP